MKTKILWLQHHLTLSNFNVFCYDGFPKGERVFLGNFRGEWETNGQTNNSQILIGRVEVQTQIDKVIDKRMHYSVTDACCLVYLPANAAPLIRSVVAEQSI